jgi:hypothetical protein
VQVKFVNEDQLEFKIECKLSEKVYFILACWKFLTVKNAIYKSNFSFQKNTLYKYNFSFQKNTLYKYNVSIQKNTLYNHKFFKPENSLSHQKHPIQFFIQKKQNYIVIGPKISI